MAKTGVPEKDPTDDLKKEFQRLVKAITEESSSDDDNGFAENVDKVIQILRDLKKEGKQKQRSSSSIEINDNRIVGLCPQEFICPLSKDIMRDPVIVSTGTTFDRSSIQKWLKEGNRTCPITQHLFSSSNLTPNHLVREMISQWCKNRGVRYPSPNRFSNKDGLTEADYELLPLLFKMLASSTLSEQKEAGKALRSLTKRLPSFREYFSESIDSIPHLLTPLTQPEIDLNLQQDLITTLMNLSTHETNKKIVAETPMVIPILMEALRSGTMETRSNAAAALFALSTLESNKSIIGKTGALKPLIELLEEGHSFVMKDVGSAIFNLCIDNNENKNRAVENGVVRVVLKKIEERVHMDEMLVILATLSSQYKAVVEMSDLGAVSCLFSLIKETNCERNKENCIAVVYRICLTDESKAKEMRAEESRYGTISKIVETGSSRAKRKANAILDRIRIRRTYTAWANTSFRT